MSDKSGKELEDEAQKLFDGMGLTCINQLCQVQLVKLDPDGDYSKGEHLEFDFLIPYGETCLVGEITARNGPSDVKKKYESFQQSYNLLKKQSLSKEDLWSLLGVPKDLLPKCRDIKEVKGCFITTKLEKFDVNLTKLTSIACFYKSDWILLEGYVKTIGKYCKEHFMHHFSVITEYPIENITLLKDKHHLTQIKHKKVASGKLAFADIFTFEISPYKILPFTQVFRKDNLPNLKKNSDTDYQRPLDIEKLQSIRKNLLINADFMFPNNILCVLSSDCKYDEKKGSLTIPMMYGALSVIDGQHRLFSFARESMEKKLAGAIIMIAAIKFHNANEKQIAEYSAKTFVEINTKQTTIDKNHLDIIAYELLGQTHSRALAAKIVLTANECRGSLYGLFKTYQTSLGIIKINEVITALKIITNLEKISKLEGAKSGAKLKEKKGYENLFEATASDLKDAETMITKGIIVFKRFFNEFKKQFPQDWPERGKNKGSSFEFAKVIAGLVKLLHKFILEGSDWSKVKEEIKKIKVNVIKLRDIADENTIILDASHISIPDAKPTVNNDLEFFNRNRIEPTSITKVLKS